MKDANSQKFQYFKEKSLQNNKNIVCMRKFCAITTRYIRMYSTNKCHIYIYISERRSKVSDCDQHGGLQNVLCLAVFKLTNSLYVTTPR